MLAITRASEQWSSGRRAWERAVAYPGPPPDGTVEAISAVRSDPAFDRRTNKHRDLVERCFARLRRWRAIATRYDKTAQSRQAAVTLASRLMWA
ncbi:hypothetical protein ACWCXE_26710 [Streptomyces sp. NPDC001780]